MFKLDLEKAEEPEIKLPIFAGSSKKQESSRKTSISALLSMPKPLTVWITINCEKFWKRWEYQTSSPASWETCKKVNKEQLELYMDQQTAFKSGKESIKAVYCHLAYLTYMQSTSWEMSGWMKHKLESRLLREMSMTSDMQWRRQWQWTPVLLPGKPHGQRSLVGCSPWDCEELDMTEWLHFHFSLSCIGEVNGNPLQCSCLENPRDGRAWWAAVYGGAQNQTQLKWLSSSSSTHEDDTTLLAESEEELKSLLMKVKEESEKVGLKLNI